MNLSIIFTSIYQFCPKCILIQLPGEPRDQNLIQASLNLPKVYIYFYLKKKRSAHKEHLQGEVLQGRSKSKYHIILFYSSVFMGPGFPNPNYLEIKKDLFSKFLTYIIQNILIGNFQSSWWSSCSKISTILKILSVITLQSFKYRTELRIFLKSTRKCKNLILHFLFFFKNCEVFKSIMRTDRLMDL